MPLDARTCAFAFLPIALVFEEVLFVPSVEHGFEEHPGHAAMAELAKAAVGGEDATTDNTKAVAGDSFGEEVVFGEEGALIEAAEVPEGVAFEEHEHTRCEWFPARANVLHDIAAGVEEVVEETALTAADTDSGEMKIATAHRAHSAANEGGIGEFDIGVEEQDVFCAGLFCTGVAANRRESARDNFDEEAVAKAERGLDGAVGRSSVGDQDAGASDVCEVLTCERGQQAGKHRDFVLRGNDDGQFGIQVRMRAGRQGHLEGGRTAAIVSLHWFWLRFHKQALNS